LHFGTDKNFLFTTENTMAIIYLPVSMSLLRELLVYGQSGNHMLYRISIIDMFCVLLVLLHIMLLYLCYFLYFSIIVHA
jgi:hypothetical protein